MAKLKKLPFLLTNKGCMSLRGKFGFGNLEPLQFERVFLHRKWVKEIPKPKMEVHFRMQADKKQLLLAVIKDSQISSAALPYAAKLSDNIV